MKLSPGLFAGLLLLALLALLAPVNPVLAQSVRGRAVDAESEEGIAAVRVVLLSADGRTVSESLSRDDGGFHLVTVEAGEYRIQSSHLAYEPVTTQPFRIEGGQEVTVNLILTTTVILLEPLEIVGRRQDPRMGSTIEGFYARQKMFTQGLGFGRVATRIDPEMVNATNPRDVLLWLEPPDRGGIIADAGCRVVYWDGRLVLSQDVADQWLDTPASFFEGVEFYRNQSDAPAAFREIPIYLSDLSTGGRVFCSVVALWPRTGYFGELPPPPPSQERLNGALAFYDLSGKLSPGPGVGIEITGHALAYRNLALGVLLRRTSHHIAGDRMEETLSALEQVPFVLPPGRRPFALWVLGPEARLTFGETRIFRPMVALRGLVARRAFTLVSNSFGTPEVTLSSFGLGVGATVGFEWLLTNRLAAHAALGYDRYAFEAYAELERAWYTSAASWQGLGLRVGVGYALRR